MRVLCLYLPQWPAQRVRVSESVEPGRPVVVHAPVRNRKVVVAHSAAASRGVVPGLPLAEAESLLEGCDPFVASLDAAADRAELEQLASACGRFGPVAGIEEAERPESVLVEVTGCAPFFGGEEPLARDAIALLSSMHYAARAGIAETVGLAWAASRVAGKGRPTLVPPGDAEAWLAPRPVALLRLAPETVSLLAGLGMRTVGDLLRLPRQELPSRFGPELLRRLDQVLGGVPEPIEPVRPALPPSVGWSNETPLVDRHLVETVVEQLLARLLSRLAPWEGCTELSCWFGGDDETTVRPATPSRSCERLFELVRLALDRQPPHETSRIVVTAETTRLPAPERTSLFSEERSDAEKERAYRRLIERLCGRLGTESVLRPVPSGEPLPERSVRLLPALDLSKQEPPAIEAVTAAASRPAVLLPEPEPVRILSVVPDGPPVRLLRAGGTVELAHAHGPERLEASWADGPEARRDYWRVETPDGERLWIYQCRRSGSWFLHGLFA